MAVESWRIISYVGVGPLEFGLSRSKARALFDSDPSPFKQGPFAINETDAYDEIGLHLHYDSKDQLRSVMAFASAPILYDHIVLLNTRLQKVLDDLAAFGLAFRFDDEGYWCDNAGFVLYAPESIVKAVTVYRRGYYEEEVALAAKIRVTGET